MRIMLTIPGTPIAKARPRFARRGKYVMTYSAQRAEEKRLKVLLQNQCAERGFEPIPAGVPVRLALWFCMPIPKSMSKKKRSEAGYHVKKPDLDNLTKFFLDCANGILWHDDSQVAGMVAQKKYAEEPLTVVVVEW